MSSEPTPRGDVEPFTPLYKQEAGARQILATKRKHRADFGPIKRRVDGAHQANSEALWNLATTVPTTAAGILALLQYTREEEEKALGSFFDADQQHEFYCSLERAVSALSS